MTTDCTALAKSVFCYGEQETTMPSAEDKIMLFENHCTVPSIQADFESLINLGHGRSDEALTVGTSSGLRSRS